MQDQHAGKAGTFYTDPESGQRLTQKEWEERQAAQKSALPKPKKTTEQE